MDPSNQNELISFKEVETIKGDDGHIEYKCLFGKSFWRYEISVTLEENY